MSVKSKIDLKPIIDTSSKKNDGGVKVPLVVTKEKNGYHGFVPGFVMNDIVSLSKEDVVAKLKIYAKQEMAKIREKNQQIPLFPSNEEIKRDFEFVVRIERVLY